MSAISAVKLFTQGIVLSITYFTHQEKTPFQCNLCNKFLSFKIGLAYHIHRHTGEKPFECRFRDMSFAHPGGLIRHEKIHSEIKTFKCEVCYKLFALKYYLNKHLVTHSGKKSFKCPQCDKYFLHKEGVGYHQKRVHLKIKTQRCNICGRLFGSNPEVESHMRTHTGEKPFKCKICFKSFASERNLTKQHMRLHQQWCRQNSGTTMILNKALLMISSNI